MVKRIAVLRALQLGDWLCAEPSVRALQARFPLAEITLIGLPWMEGFATRYPHVGRFLPFPGCAGIREVPYRPEVTESFLAAAQRERYDLAVQMHGAGPESSAFVAALGASLTLGYTLPGTHSPLHLAVPYPAESVHEARKWLGLVAHVGATGPAVPELPVLPEEEAEAAGLLAPLDRTRPIVAFHAGSREPARRWPPVRFAALADSLHEALACQILLTGSPQDAPDNAQVLAAAHSPILDLTGKTSIGSLAALLNQVDLLVTNDSGPSHVAWARGVPSIILFGPSDPARWAPLQGGLHHAVISPSRDLRDLSLERVQTAVATMLARTGAARRAPLPISIPSSTGEGCT